jgi:UDP-3-O-[3-hydroxymyristoyl] glucosamine N-acyltransferase
MSKLGSGAFLYPFVVVAANAIINTDVIFQGFNAIAHNTVIGKGTVLDIRSSVCGSVTVGNFCHLHTETVVYDKISIVDNVEISANSKVRKNISQSGTYASIIKNVFKKIK